MKNLFTIGEMQRLFSIPVRTLRFYDDIGILHPEQADPRTGYRYYSAAQFERLNTIKYLRALGVSLDKIRGFFENRDTAVIESLLCEQLADTRRQLDELHRIERRIERRLTDLQRARTAVLDTVRRITLPAREIVFLRQDIPQDANLEFPIRDLEREHGLEPMMFLGKVGVSIAREKLLERSFDRFSGIFVFVEPEERHTGPSASLPAGDWLSLCFRGTHTRSAEGYTHLLDEAERLGGAVTGDSVEVTHIDGGFTSDEGQYLTELQIPVKF